MKPEKALLHTAQAVLHILRLAAKCFIRRQECFITPPFQMKHCSAFATQYEAFAFRKYEAQAAEAACIIWNVRITFALRGNKT